MATPCSTCGTMGQHGAAVLLHGLQQTPGSHLQRFGAGRHENAGSNGAILGCIMGYGVCNAISGIFMRYSGKQVVYTCIYCIIYTKYWKMTGNENRSWSRTPITLIHN